MSSHRIQLKGPWEVLHPEVSINSPSSNRSKVTTTMPQEWRTLFGDVGGTAQFHRKFHRPSNLESHERIFLVLTGVCGQTKVRLNRRLIGEFASPDHMIELDISSLMNSFNLLEVEITFDPTADPNLPGGLYGVVALDIRWDDSSTNSN